MPPTEGGIDKGLLDGLKRARKVPADRPYFFAMVVKGAADGKLIVSKRKVPEKVIAAAKKEVGGTVVVKGVCFGEDGQIVFETVKPPVPAWTVLAKKLGKEDAGLLIKPVFRQGRDDEQLPDEFPSAPEDEAPDTGGEQDQTAEPDAGRAQAKADAAAWQARVEAVTARIKAAAAGGHPAARDMVLALSQAQAFFRGGDPAKADARLKDVEALLAGPATPTTGAPPAPPKSEPPPAPPTQNGKPDLTAWAAARAEAINKLKAVAKEAAAAKHAESAKAVIELNGVIKNLTAEPATKQQVAELERWLADDDVVADVCEMAEDIRTPLLKVLADLKSQLSA